MSLNLTPLYTIILLALIMPVNKAFAQKNDSKPDHSKNHTYKDLAGYTAFLSQTEKDHTATLDKKLQKEYSQIIKEKNTGLIKEIGEHNFLFDTEVYPYLTSIFYHIVEKNGLDKKQFHFFVNRTSAVNAYSYEDGTIVCDLGLLNIMENESQLAMIFCHELGHYLLKHVNGSITSQLTLYHSPEFIARVKKITRQEYNSRKQLDELMTSNLFNRRRHNRSQESAADSLGMVLFRNTAYDGTHVSHVFDILATAESDTNTGTLKNFFTREGISIDEDLLRPAKKMTFSSVKKEVVDSLKTHPDCASRKVIMQAGFNIQPKTGTEFLIADAQKLLAIKRMAWLETATYSKEKDDLSYYLYQLIENDAVYPADPLIKSQIFETLSSLCQHQKDHTFHRVVSTQYIAEDEKDEYATLLKLLDSIDMAKLTEITVQYYNKNKSYITASAEAIDHLKQLKN